MFLCNSFSLIFRTISEVQIVHFLMFLYTSFHPLPSGFGSALFDKFLLEMSFTSVNLTSYDKLR